MARTWPFPDLRNGTTLHHFTDPHHGALNHDPLIDNWATRMAADLDFLKVANNTGHLNSGDCIQLGPTLTSPSDRATEVASYKAWRDTIQTADGLPWAEAEGNHDNRTADGEGVLTYTAEDWAADLEIDSHLMAHDWGDVKVLTLGPDVWDINNPANPTGVNIFRLPEATLDWLASELMDDTPTFIVCHLVLSQQFPTITENGYNAADVANPGLIDVLQDAPGTIIWPSGHKHVPINTHPVDHARVFSLPGGKKIFGINAPACIGGTLGNVADADHQWQSVSQSLSLTLLDDTTLDVRWRDHNRRSWTGPGTERFRQLTLGG